MEGKVGESGRGQWKFSYVLSSKGVVVCCFCVVYAHGLNQTTPPAFPSGLAQRIPKNFALGLAPISL